MTDTRFPIVDLPDLLPYICAQCWTQYEKDSVARCPDCLVPPIPTDALGESFYAHCARVLRECYEATAWIPGNWIDDVVARQLAAAGLLSCRETTHTKHAYQITVHGVDAMGDPPADLPEHVSDWYQSATMVVEVLAECLEPVRDTLGEFPYRKVERAMAALSRADKLIERMRRQLERGRDMAAGRYAVADGYGTTTIQ